MFTGIIEKVGTVLNIETVAGSSRKITLQTGFTDLELGESVAVNGVCLTVAETSAEPASNSSQNDKTLFFVNPETMIRTNLKELVSGSKVNLERAMTPSGRLSGHWVQGHVDGVCRLEKITPIGESYETTFSISSEFTKYLVSKGSICLNGVSLTINSLDTTSTPQKTLFKIMMIPHTWNHTHFHALKEGAEINFEIDILAKYVENLCQNYLKHLSS